MVRQESIQFICWSYHRMFWIILPLALLWKHITFSLLFYLQHIYFHIIKWQEIRRVEKGILIYEIHHENKKNDIFCVSLFFINMQHNLWCICKENIITITFILQCHRIFQPKSIKIYLQLKIYLYFVFNKILKNVLEIEF